MPTKMKKVYESIKEILSEANSKQAAPKYSTQQYIDWAKKYADEHGVPHSVVLHSMFKETGRSGDPEKMRAARNPRSGASGVMQIMPQYAPHAPYKVDTKDLFDPEKNIAAGVRGLAYYYKQHRNPKLKEGETDINAAKKALASYNAGENYVERKDKQGKIYYSGAGKYIKTGNPKDLPRKETRDYIADYKDDVDYQLSRFFPKADKQASGAKSNDRPEKVEVKPAEAPKTVEVKPVEAPKAVEVKPVAAPKAEVKPVPSLERPREAAPSSTENPYTPGTRDHAFKQARIDGKKEFTDPTTGKKIAVKLKDTQESVQLTGEAKVEPNMKRIYESAKQILREKTEAPSWGANLMKVFRGETLTSPGRESNLQKQANAEREAEIAQINAQAAARAKAEQDRKAAEAAKQKVNQAAIAALSPKRDDGTAQAASARGGKKPEKQAAPKKELSPFEQEFAAARAKGKKEFTWYDKQGRPYQVATKLKGEEEPPKSKVVAPETKPEKDTRTLPRTSQNRNQSSPQIRTQTRSVATDTSKDTSLVTIPKSEMDAIDVEKERQKNAAAAKPEPAAEKPAPVPEPEAADQTSTKQEQPAEEPKKEKPKVDYTKGLLGQKNSNKTNEEKQMSLNKKFNVSDALYNSVMEVMAKSSGGTVPKNEKQKQLAAHHGDPNLITHGDVLKARGVKMKEENDLDEKVTIYHSTSPGAQQKRYQKDSPAPEAAAHRKSAADAARAERAKGGVDRYQFNTGVEAKTKKGGTVFAYKTQTEDIEQVDELSRGKLVGYIEKASKTKGAEAMARISGIKKAAAKLKDIKKQSMQSEDVEQVDEISRKTLGSYVRKASDKAREHAFYGGIALTKGKLGQSDYHAKKEEKRDRGIYKATDRLQKEEALDEAKKLISKHGEDQPISAKVYKDTEWNEYQVHYFKNGKHMGEGPVSYHGDDKEDAQNTANHEVKRMNNVKEDWVDSKGKFHKEAPPPGQVPSPDEGYRPPKAQPRTTGKKTQPGNTTKAMDVEEQEVRLIKKSGEKIVPDTSEVIRARTMKNQAAIDAMGPSMKSRSEYILKQDAADPSSKYHDAAKKVLSDRKSAVKEENVQEMSSKQKMKLGLYNKKKSSVKENTDTPGNSYEHQCAIHVKSESFGEGRTITTQHADPDEYGNIAWYDVMFEHGIEKYVPTNKLEILVSESHMHSKRKKKVAEETGEERNNRLSRENERFKAAEAGNYQGRNARGDVIKSGGEVVKANPNPPSMVDKVKGKLGLPNNATDALGDPMYKSSRSTTGGSGGGSMGGGGPGMAGSTSSQSLLRMMNPQKIY